MRERERERAREGRCPERAGGESWKERNGRDAADIA